VTSVDDEGLRLADEGLRLADEGLRLGAPDVILHQMNTTSPLAQQAAAQAPRSAIMRLPRHAPGMRIGLLGGSFNPAHEGHRLISLIALRRLNLDCIWWLVTPGNPLKQASELADLPTRLKTCAQIANHPALIISDFESTIGTHFTYDTLRHLTQRCAGVNFVWLMGADNLASFHLWYRWRDIARLMPLAVIDRPGNTLRASHSKAALYLEKYRIDEAQGRSFASAPAPALMFVHGPRSAQSSSALRAQTGRNPLAKI